MKYRGGGDMRETKQDVINDIRSRQGLEPMEPVRGSSIRREFFADIAREMGLRIETSMPSYARAILAHVGIAWRDDFSSESSPSGGGSTVTFEGLCAVRDAYFLWSDLDDAENESDLKFQSWAPDITWQQLRSEVEREVQLVMARPGATEFRSKILDAYQSSCAISTTREALVLEAAHIVPYHGEMSDVIQNGILLRSDFHKLFDGGKFDIDYNGSGELFVSWVEGALSDHYRNFLGGEIYTPSEPEFRPSPNALQARRNYLNLPTK
jgi:hypothetical protein